MYRLYMALIDEHKILIQAYQSGYLLCTKVSSAGLYYYYYCCYYYYYATLPYLVDLPVVTIQITNNPVYLMAVYASCVLYMVVPAL